MGRVMLREGIVDVPWVVRQADGDVGAEAG
jgi:hypothetical protein